MKKNGKRVAVHNLGCKVNSYEAELMLRDLEARGYEIVPFEETADVYIVNTCTVTQIADKKSRQMLHRARRRNPDALVVAAGCYVETGEHAIEEDGSVDLAITNREKPFIAGIVETYLETGEIRKPVMPDEQENDRTCFSGQILTSCSTERAFIRIQDGCDQFCSYCVIPYARGRARSRDRDEILREVHALTESGVREIVISGIHLSSYGQLAPQRFNSRALTDLLGRIAEIDGVKRIRLGSLEPRLIDAETARELGRLCDPAEGGKLCPHFHLSLQSGCDETLRRMNRHYTAAEYAAGAALLREAIDRPALTTDVITGFPGETEEEFEQTRRFLGELALYEIHVFPYSVRKGTVAATLPGQNPRSVKEARSAVLLALTAAQARAYRESFLGQEAEVLWEEEEEIAGRRVLTGHTRRYIKAAVPAGSRRPGDITAVKLSGFLTDEVMTATAEQ